MPIGPQLPPHLAPPTDAKDSDSEDDFGPALPPSLAAKRTEAPKTRDIGPQMPGPSMGPSIGPNIGPSIGPSVGPSIGTSRSGPSAAPDSDSDDDIVGPVPGSPAKEMSAADAFREREARWAREREEGPSSSSAKPQRAEWMLVPPSAGIAASLDPTKRPTSFAKTSREGVSAAEQKVWTETPAEKARRLQDEVAGIKRGRDGDDSAERQRKRERDEEIRRNIEAHNKSSRGGSLLSQHQKKKAEDDDDEAPAFWDHSKHMGITGRLLSSEERSKKIQDARNLNDRFGHGKGGAYAS